MKAKVVKYDSIIDFIILISYNLFYFAMNKSLGNVLKKKIKDFRIDCSFEELS